MTNLFRYDDRPFLQLSAIGLCAAMARVPPEPNRMSDRVNAFVRPPILLVSNAM